MNIGDAVEKEVGQNADRTHSIAGVLDALH